MWIAGSLSSWVAASAQRSCMWVRRSAMPLGKARAWLVLGASWFGRNSPEAERGEPAPDPHVFTLLAGLVIV